MLHRRRSESAARDVLLGRAGAVDANESEQLAERETRQPEAHRDAGGHQEEFTENGHDHLLSKAHARRCGRRECAFCAEKANFDGEVPSCVLKVLRWRVPW